ncbi:Uncharacterised protein [Pseudomonas aeruginosa]|nr:Uncharacterised protein [Pseudomonas aeruginosa]
MKRIFLLPLLPLALGAATVDKTRAMAMAVRAQDDQEALEWCKKAAPDDYQWILEQCMQIRADSISQADDMVLQEKLMKRLNEIEQTLTKYPETGAPKTRPGTTPARSTDPVNTKGSALVIPLLPPRAREAGEIKLPLPPLRRLLAEVGSRVRSARDFRSPDR